VLKKLNEAGESFDVLFFDPPYGHDHLAHILPLCCAITAPHGVVVTEHEPNEILPDSANGLVLSDRRRYGSTAISIYRPTANAEAHA
jgi:16S rRNA G966 N2-methylase RsmD